MRINELSHSSIDKERWDQTLESSLNYLPYAYSWYLDVVSPKWDALVSEDYQFIFPLTWKKKYFIKYLCQPFFTQQLGLFSPEKIDAATLSSFIRKIPANIRLIEINLNYANTPALTGHPSVAKTNLELDLSSPYNTIRNKYSDNVKRNIAKAEKNKLEFVNHCEVDDILHLFHQNKGATLENFRPVHYTLLNSLYTALRVRSKGITAGVLQNKKLIAGALFIVTDHRIIFLFSGNSAQGKQSGAMHYLIDKVIQTYSATPRIYDFEGSNQADLARFYRSFGSVENVYLHLQKNTFPYVVRMFKK